MTDRDPFQYRHIHRLAEAHGLCLITWPRRGRYLLCLYQTVVQEFTDIESVEAWLTGKKENGVEESTND